MCCACFNLIVFCYILEWLITRTNSTLQHLINQDGIETRLIKIGVKSRKTEQDFRELDNRFEGKIHTLSFIKTEYKVDHK